MLTVEDLPPAHVTENRPPTLATEEGARMEGAPMEGAPMEGAVREGENSDDVSDESGNLVNMGSADGGPVSVFFHDGRVLHLSLNFIQTTFAELYQQCQHVWGITDEQYTFYVRGAKGYLKVSNDRTLKECRMEPHGHILLLPGISDVEHKPFRVETAATASDETKQLSRLNKLKEFYESRDIDGDGQLTRGELRSIIAPCFLVGVNFRYIPRPMLMGRLNHTIQHPKNDPSPYGSRHLKDKAMHHGWESITCKISVG